MAQNGLSGPPVGFLKDVQTVLVDFFWDKLYWELQSVLYVPREEGGEGLIHLQSRAAAFRLHIMESDLVVGFKKALL